MEMFFHVGGTEVILFRQWHTRDSAGIAASMVGIILLTIIYEGIKSYRDHLYINTARLRKHRTVSRRSQLLFSRMHILQTVVHVIQLVIGYFLMLIFMTYNAWLCIAVALGAALGYWVFSWEKSSGDNIDCCL
ncbi:hypothetical protein QLX08_007278 [Tetragonisca angustula]|uniref:Copper transport protein n=1 Tax=Tetragonisca angustula TaxID=166442 RepID=A0AAW0ZQK0_9HYME